MPIGGMAFFGQNQHPRLTTNYLNQLNRHGDPGAGVNVSTAEVSGSIVQEYLGFAGGKLTITDPWAPQFADPAVGPIYGGVYMYVRVNPLDSAPLERGAVVFWQDELHYIVTAKGMTGSVPHKIAGVAVNETFPGNWDFFQIAGIASVKMGGAGAIGNAAIVTPTSTGSTVAAAGTSITNNFIGIVVLTPAVSGQLSPVQLNILQGWNF